MAQLNSGGKRRIWRLGLALGLVLAFSWLVRAELKVGEEPVRDYRVVYLEPPSSDSVKVQANLENLVGYHSRLYKSTFEGKPVYVLERDEYTKKNDHFYWKMYLEPANLSLLRIERRAVSRTGKTVFERWIDYRDPIFNHPQPLCHVYTITIFLMNKPLKVGDRYDMYMITSEDSAPWHMFINITALQKVKVPAGEFECFVASLEPDYDYIMGKWSWTAPVIKRFVPAFTFWMAKPEPHPLIKFEGVLGPAGGSPPQVHELVSLSPAPK